MFNPLHTIHNATRNIFLKGALLTALLHYAHVDALRTLIFLYDMHGPKIVCAVSPNVTKFS